MRFRCSVARGNCEFGPLVEPMVGLMSDSHKSFGCNVRFHTGEKKLYLLAGHCRGFLFFRRAGGEKETSRWQLDSEDNTLQKVFQNAFGASLRGGGVSFSFEINPKHPLQASLWRAPPRVSTRIDWWNHLGIRQPVDDIQPENVER